MCQQRKKNADGSRQPAPSCRLLFEDLQSKQVDHIVQTRVGTIGDDTCNGRMRRQQKSDGCAHRKSVNVDLAGYGFRLTRCDIDRSHQIADLCIPTCRWQQRALAMPTIIEKQDIHTMCILERGNRAKIAAGQMKSMADNYRRRALRLRPKLTTKLRTVRCTECHSALQFQRRLSSQSRKFPSAPLRRPFFDSNPGSRKLFNKATPK